MELRRVVLSLFLASVQSLIEIPPIDRYPLPPRLYNEHPDPSRTIIDASLNDDVLDWKQYEMEFMQQSRAVIYHPNSSRFMDSLLL